MDLECSWCRPGVCLVCSWHVLGVVLVCAWFVPGVDLVVLMCSWRGTGVVLVWTWCGPGVVLMCCWCGPFHHPTPRLSAEEEHLGCFSFLGVMSSSIPGIPVWSVCANTQASLWGVGVVQQDLRP